MKPAAGELEALTAGRHADPFRLLGPHAGPAGVFARTLVPGAEQVTAHTLGGQAVGELAPVADHPGLFEGVLPGLDAPEPLRLRARGGGAEWWTTDPYSFGPVLGPVDDLLLAEGTHNRLFDKLGAHALEHEGAHGVHFAVWAPDAERVSVVGPFNDWDGRRHVMRRRSDVGVWEIFLPEVTPLTPYKFELLGPGGAPLPLKADPFARRSELRPSTASVVEAPTRHQWGDAAHRAHWASVDPRRQPMSIYEVHPGSWRRRLDGSFQSWDEMAAELIPYVVDLGFTHIEFLPVSEHPYDPSWGYQTLGLYAPTARFGEPEGLMRFVDGAHRAGVGVILDWVPAHFPTDAHGLAQFDGTALYEHEDPRQGFHPDWNTAIYNFGRSEVKSFLVNNALYWPERFHIDGLRVDAVASMLYRDYSRKAGEWAPNAEGGRENWEAVEFLQAANREVYGAHPGVFTVAEESTAWPGVTRPAHEGGLGFGFKWNMGWMHDTLSYFSRDAVHRRHHHDEITFGPSYAFSENFVLPLSHDEVVHGKGSLLAKMSGDDWGQFANLRALYGLMWGFPGKKLLFMGQEFAQRREWSEARALDWELLGAPAHAGVRDLVRELNGLHRERPALHARDCEGEGFRWSVVDDRDQSVFAWTRHAAEAPPVAVIANLTPAPREGYRLRLPVEGPWREILNTDARRWGGSGFPTVAAPVVRDGWAELSLPPLAVLMLEPAP